MPRPTKERIDHVQEVEPVRRRQEVRVAARPVPVHNPVPFDSARPLVEALSSFNPALRTYIQREAEEASEEQRMAGAKARASQADSGVVIPPEATDSFREGYMQMHGQVAGGDVARKLTALFDENKDKPGFDPEKASRLLLDEEMKGMTDKDALKGFLPAVVGAQARIKDAWSKLQVERVRQDTEAQVQARARDLVELPIRGDEEGVPTDPAQTRHALYQQFVEQGMKLGKTRKELAETFASALVNRAIDARDPSILDVANIRDSSGIALIDNPALGAHIAKAREAAEKLQKQDIIEATVGERTNTLHALYETLRTNPMSPELDWENLGKHQGTHLTFNDPEGKDRVAFYEKVLEARQKVLENQDILKALDGPQARIAAADPRAKPLISARYGQLWGEWQKAVESGDPDATKKFMRINLSLHQQWGVADERLKAYLSNINSEPDKDGKPSADFVRAVEFYSAIQDSPNKDLIMDLTDERSRTLLRHFHEMVTREGIPQNAAFARAKELNTPEGQERAKALATPETRNAFRSKLEGMLKGGSWYTFGLTGRAPNKDLFINELTNVFERKLTYLGDRERAMKQTLDSVEEYLTRDVNENWTQRPDVNLLASRGKSQQDFERGLRAYTMDLNEQLKKEGRADATYHLTRIGQGSGYIVHLNGSPTDRVELDEILQRGAAAFIGTDEAVSLSALAKQAKAGKMTGEQVNERLYDLMQLHAIGTIDSLTFERLQSVRRKWQKDNLGKEVDRVRALQKSALGGINPKDILSEPGGLPESPKMQPSGKALKTADYALQALQKGNLTFALTAQAEGFETKKYSDPSKGENIGLGFSLTARSKPETASMLRRAGVPSGDVEAVMKGHMEVQPEVVVRLHEIAVEEYRKKAIRAIGADAWKTLKPEAQAVLTDMAWATGKPSQFTEVLEAMRKGDWNGASAALSLKYTARNGERKDDHRRVNLWRLMLSGSKTYAQYLQQHTSN